ncbi:hypothetical protein SMD44_00117 [Streptomyces alboflavus]|uniref:Uncharacterized protein n=1 Tax=Streptomyces alboflavus TaxID=67267 RepID=A0A1Z1W2T4_9ACTN|nr:hypothetical protein SMD44_00117 [Streptomyces alboflavus]
MNPCGRFELDMNSRLQLDLTIPAAAMPALSPAARRTTRYRPGGDARF